jgi:hypothetical protein
VGYIGSEHIAPISQTAYCSKCRQVWKQRDLKELRLFVLPVAKWAYVMAREVLRAECRADVYMKWAGSEKLKERTLAEMSRERRGSELYVARKAREPVMYEVARLIRDVNAGSSIEARMRALITG